MDAPEPVSGFAPFGRDIGGAMEQRVLDTHVSRYRAEECGPARARIERAAFVRLRLKAAQETVAPDRSMSNR